MRYYEKGDHMKKVLLVLLLMLSMAFISHAKESASDGESDTSEESSSSGKWKEKLGATVRVGYSFPFLADMLTYYSETEETSSTAAYAFTQIVLAFAFSSVGIGGGVHYTIIPHILAPGLYVDMHFNLLSWGIASLFTKSDFIMLQGGIRLFNQFGFKIISIEPFFGFNFIYLKVDDLKMPLPLLAAGFVFNIARFSIEYDYSFYPRKHEGIPLLGFHRFTLSGIIWKK
jgi:hypothetical protein